ncbi:MAG: NAD-dependent epimerase/dehydratase family protein [Deltaproteobacteria bacterium]
MNFLISGGAGFVGSSIALHFKKKFAQARVVAFDNLKRRGSEVNWSLLREAGVEFIHGDIRNPNDFDSLSGNWDAFFECSAEPSVLAGLQSSPRYLLDTNLLGTINCLEFARKSCGLFIFLSTSRVYSLTPLKKMGLTEGDTRFVLSENQDIPGLSSNGISESFPCDTSRSLYGTSKLASEYLVQEYAELYNMPAYINRCGVIAGPGQFGKVDQGVYTLWVARHFFNQPLKYTGFGGLGKQVRDLLHIKDLLALLEAQFENRPNHLVETFNVGGGNFCSVSLLELTQICQQATGNQVSITSETESSSVDIPWYISDCTKIKSRLDWQPKLDVKDIVVDIRNWLSENQRLLKSVFS